MKKFAVLAVVSACVLASCSQGKKEEAAGPTYNVDVPVKEIMGHVVDPAAQTFWRYSGDEITAEGTTSRLPKTEEQWEEAMNGAVGIIEAGNLLKLPGRARDNGDWMKFADQLTKQGIAARAAVEAKDGQRMFDTGGTVYEVCLACHEKYLLPFLDQKTGEPLPGSPLDTKEAPKNLDENGAPKVKS